MLEISVNEVPLSGIKSAEQLAAFVLKSLGLSDLNDERDVALLLAFIRNKGGMKVSELKEVAKLGQTATYSRIRKFLDAGLIYKAKGSVYRLRERTLKDTLDFRVRKDIDRVFNSIVEVSEELEKKIK
jgi:predicted transcriptional regulator